MLRRTGYPETPVNSIPPAASALEVLQSGTLRVTALVEQREFADAERLLRQAETTFPPYAARARFNLGCLLALQGRNQEAEASFHWVIDGRDPTRPRRHDPPGRTLLPHGRFEESERLYRLVLASGHPEFTSLATLGLADIRRRRGS